jgi:hypothetical protein
VEILSMEEFFSFAMINPALSVLGCLGVLRVAAVAKFREPARRVSRLGIRGFIFMILFITVYILNVGLQIIVACH